MTNISTPLSHFKEQFNFEPTIVNKEKIAPFTHVIVCGMGGSAISVSLLKILFPEISITLHNSYGLPVLFNKASTLLIINSYSGNTEEELEAYAQGVKIGANMAVLSLGGKLIELASSDGIPYVQLPESSLEPRFSIGHQIVGLLTFTNQQAKIQTLKEKISFVDLEKTEQRGKELSLQFKDKFPVIYSSSNLYPVAYLIKAAINEGAKTPSFVNQIPEANHNELQSFITDETRSESNSFAFLFLKSTFDHTRIQKRFSVMETMYEERGFVHSGLQTDHTDIQQIFTLIITGYYMATYMALQKNIDPYKTPFIAEFKKRMTE